MINFNNHKPEVLSEKLYLKSSITLFKHEKLSEINRFRKTTTHLNRYKYLKRFFLTSSLSRR